MIDQTLKNAEIDDEIASVAMLALFTLTATRS